MRATFRGAPFFAQGYLAHKKQHPPGTLHHDSALGPMVALGEGAVSYERGTPVARMARASGEGGAKTQSTVILFRVGTGVPRS